MSICRPERQGPRASSGFWAAAALLALALGTASCSGSAAPPVPPVPTLTGAAAHSTTVELLPFTQTPAQPRSALPDLVATNVSLELETAGACVTGSPRVGTRVVVGNEGSAEAGPFVVESNGVRELVAAGLPAGGVRSLWLPGYAAEGATSVMIDAATQVRESNEDNNRFSQRLPIPTMPAPCTPVPGPSTGTPVPSPSPAPTDPPPPTAAPTPRPPSVSVREEQTTILTYPYARYTAQGWSEPFRMSYPVLDRGAYQASNPAPVDATYRTVVLENEYVRLTFLPDLGGRLYEVFYKPTGHRETYRNPVLKPSPWGPSEQGWWLAAGGIEWCLPVEEHGYEWGTPWLLETRRVGTGVTATLRDSTADDRVRASIEVRLEAGAASFTIRPRLENPTGAPLAVKYWTNAMLAPGGRNAPSSDLRFVLPDAVTGVTVHSRGDEWLPGYNQRMPWPIVDGRDLGRLGNWSRWLGFFEDPAVGDFAAVYDLSYDEGMVRVFPSAIATGAKAFGFGWSDPISAANWTDDGSSYVELHGGPAPTFDDSVTLPAGGYLEWTEVWYPVAGIGGLRHANGTAALNLEAGGGQARLAASVTRHWTGEIVLLMNGQERWRLGTILSPGLPWTQKVPLGEDLPEAAELTLRLVAQDGAVSAEYSARFGLR